MKLITNPVLLNPEIGTSSIAHGNPLADSRWCKERLHLS